MEKNYKILEPISIDYNVGREGIGVVNQSYSPGDIVKGSETPDNKLRVRAIHFANGKHYNTPIFLEPGSFALTTDVIVSQKEVDFKSELTEYVTLGVGIWFALLISSINE
jgi:hypothetical protein